MAGESPGETTNYLGRSARSVKRFPLPVLSAGFKSMTRQGCCCVSWPRMKSLSGRTYGSDNGLRRQVRSCNCRVR